MASRERESRRSNVRRTNVTACTRCRSRKQRCDQRIPACSNCERAGVPCVSTDIDGQVAPRSYIKSLEDQVAYLESQLAHREVLGFQSSPTNFAASQLSGVSLSRDPVEQVALQCLETTDFSNSIISSNGQSLLRTLLAGPIRSVSQAAKHNDHRSLLDELPYETRAVFPKQDAASRLIDAYFEHCEFFSPIIPSKEQFLTTIAPLYNDSRCAQSSAEPAVTLAKFRAYTVFATAVLLLNRTDSSFPMSRADNYFATAIQLIAQNPAVICTGDLEQLCNFLLIAQHSCFASNLTAAWHFLGLASRLAIELNLHDERAVAARLEPAQLNQRRWFFWALYTIERNLCVIVGRPFSIPDEAIWTPLPDLAEGDRSRALALHLVKYRRFESEIYTTLNQKPPQNGAVVDLFAWRDNIRQRLIEWLDSVPTSTAPSTQLAPLDVFEAILHNSFVLLYYPSPSFPNPSETDILILAQSATKCISNYRLTFRDGCLRFFWRTTHNLFRSGVAMAYCVHLQATDRYPGLNQAEMVTSVNTCMSILWAMVERYPPGRVYRDAFEILANSVLKSTESTASVGHMQPRSPSQFVYDPSVMADIALPQTAMDTLYWGFGDLA